EAFSTNSIFRLIFRCSFQGIPWSCTCQRCTDIKSVSDVLVLHHRPGTPMLAVARASTELDFRSDPADELIAATSIVHRVPLVTRDRRIRRSRKVRFA
ncbi:MAG: hypothetical protein ACYDCL_23495, partial [Myxococcales bacterium]